MSRVWVISLFCKVQWSMFSNIITDITLLICWKVFHKPYWLSVSTDKTTDKHFSLVSEDDFLSGSWNITHQQQGTTHNMTLCNVLFCDMKCCTSYCLNPTVHYSIFCRFPWYDLEEDKETGMYMLNFSAVHNVFVCAVIYVPCCYTSPEINLFLYSFGVFGEVINKFCIIICWKCGQDDIFLRHLVPAIT